jgi:endoglucanase
MTGPKDISRREFLAAAGAALGAATGALGGEAPAAGAEPRALPVPSPKKLPRWRGFNLLEKFTLNGNAPFRERDFEWIARWGFDFVRLPMDYRCWTDQARPGVPDGERGEKNLKEVDAAVEMGKRHGVHVNLNLHRGPGYCVNPPKEPLDLWKEGAAVEAFCAQWALLARRYKGIPSARVSFDLLNEPADIKPDVYAPVVRKAVEAIRAEDPERLVIADGLRWGREPVTELVSLGIGQSTRGYDPMRVSHHRASWIGGSDRWEEPSWPLVEGGGRTFDKERLRKERIEPWKALEAKGVGVHVGEWGAFQRCPRKTALAWMKDCLDLWKEAGWGWALWNLRGSFGIVDSRREGTTYEDFEGHKLDKEMLELLRA